MCHPGLSRECLRWRAELHHPGRESAACVLTFFSHETLARRCFDLLARACAAAVAACRIVHLFVDGSSLEQRGFCPLKRTLSFVVLCIHYRQS